MAESTLLSAAAAAEFLYEEARLLDAHDYDAWLTLWDDDALYWIPCDGATDPHKQVAIIADDRRRLSMRVAQLQTGYRHAQLPQSRTQHYITNVTTAEGDDSELITVNSSYLVIEARFGQVNFWPGQATHLLRAVDDGSLRIARKTLVLLNNDLPVPSMGFIP